MKTLLKNFWVIPLLLIGLLLADGCKKDSESKYQCDNTTINGETVKACCNDENCYYEWNGKKYYCNGYDCDDAAQRLVNDIYGKSLPIDNETRIEQVIKLLNQTR